MELFKALIKLISGDPEQSIDIKTTEERSLDLKVTVTYNVPDTPEVDDSLVEAEYNKWAFVEDLKLPAPKRQEIWFHFNRRTSTTPKRLPRWLKPIVPRNDFGDESIRTAFMSGPRNLPKAAIALRKRIRAQRKDKADISDELDSLHRIAVLENFTQQMTFPQIEGVNGELLWEYVTHEDLRNVQVEYSKIGFKHLSILGVTDHKWLTQQFGEPHEHNILIDIYPHLLRNAVSRYAWQNLKEQNEYRINLGQEKLRIREWMQDRLRQYLGYLLEWQQRVQVSKNRKAKREERITNVTESIELLNDEFVVADIETTGLKRYSDSIIEVGAICFTQGFCEVARFSAFVRTDDLPPKIEQLTGISKNILENEGLPLNEVMHNFSKFVGTRPLFFQNASFDLAFLKQGYEKAGLSLINDVHDSLEVFRIVWQGLSSYRLQTLAKRFSVPKTKAHRALEDAQTTASLLKMALIEYEANKSLEDNG